MAAAFLQGIEIPTRRGRRGVGEGPCAANVFEGLMNCSEWSSSRIAFDLTSGRLVHCWPSCELIWLKLNRSGLKCRPLMVICCELGFVSPVSFPVRPASHPPLLTQVLVGLLPPAASLSRRRHVSTRVLLSVGSKGGRRGID